MVSLKLRGISRLQGFSSQAKLQVIHCWMTNSWVAPSNPSSTALATYSCCKEHNSSCHSFFFALKLPVFTLGVSCECKLLKLDPGLILQAFSPAALDGQPGGIGVILAQALCFVISQLGGVHTPYLEGDLFCVLQRFSLLIRINKTSL